MKDLVYTVIYLLLNEDNSPSKLMLPLLIFFLSLGLKCVKIMVKVVNIVVFVINFQKL